MGGFVVDAGYLRLISGQGPGFESRVAFVAGFIALMSVLAICGGILSEGVPPASSMVLIGAASGFFSLGLIALFSIGTSLILLGLLAISAVGPTARSWRPVAAPLVGSVALLALGLIVTS